jgi:hypothetical protein
MTWIYILLFGFIILILAIKYYAQYLYFFPDTKYVCNIPDGIKEVAISKSPRTGNLYGIFKQESNEKVILYCHGNAGNIYMRLNIFPNFECDVLLFDYSGFGKSNGKACVDEILLDVECAYQYLLYSGYSSENIIVYGESIGCPIAAYLCTKHYIPKLILQSGPSSMNDVIKHFVPGIGRMIGLLVDHLNTYDYLNKIHPDTKVLIMHSQNDEVVPFECATKIKHYSNKFLEIGGGHNTPIIPFSEVNDFIS